MAPPPVTIYVTSLTSAPKVRKHIDLLRRSLNGLEIPYEEYDLVMDEEAKKKWQRSKPPGMIVGLPGYLVGGEWVGTMDDFEDAVETQTLETFLKQDIDLSHSNDTFNPSSSAATASGGLPTQKSIQEVELENLMREMTNEDLDKLMGELDVDKQVGRVGLITKDEVPPPEEKKKEAVEEKHDEGISDVKETDKSLLKDLKAELKLDEGEDKLLGGVEQDEFSKSTPTTSKKSDNIDDTTKTTPGIATKSEYSEKNDENEKGVGIRGMIEENDILNELRDELKVDKNEDRDIDSIVRKAKID